MALSLGSWTLILACLYLVSCVSEYRKGPGVFFGDSTTTLYAPPFQRRLMMQKRPNAPRRRATKSGVAVVASRFILARVSGIGSGRRRQDAPELGHTTKWSTLIAFDIISGMQCDGKRL